MTVPRSYHPQEAGPDTVRINPVSADTVLAMVEGILPDEKGPSLRQPVWTKILARTYGLF